jgi:hypothetical protein
MAGVRRLDDKGFHLTPVRKAKGRRYEWVGEPRQVQDGNYVDYDGLKIFEGDRMLLVTKGVILFLSNEHKGEPTEVCTCEWVYEANQKGKPYAWIHVTWFWRPEGVEFPDEYEAHPRELFSSSMEDNNPWESIEMCAPPIPPAGCT